MAITTNRSCATIILAAGEGTRMKSSLPKVLHKVASLPMACHVVKCAQAAMSDEIAVITGNGRDIVEAEIERYCGKHEFFEQTERLGTAHAVLAAREVLERTHDDILVLFGDTPLLQPQTLVEMREHLAAGADVAVLGFEAENPEGYGRLLIENDSLIAIREDRDCSEREKLITFCNGGIMAINGAKCLALLDGVKNDNAKGEFYLTDIVEIAHIADMKVVAHRGDETEILGINTKVELAEAEKLWQANARRQMMLEGVGMIAPETVYLAHDTIIGADTLIEPHQFFGPHVEVGKNVHLKAHGHYEACKIGDRAQIGPYARLRPGADMGEDTKVGNFVEIKQAQISKGAKVNHLTYVGDANVGENANIGAGTITCNYDGVNKHVTQIGANSFIGSNSALVAPVKIGAGAYIGSGSVVTEDVPDEALAIARSKQVVKPGRAKLLKEKALAEKKARSAE